MIENIDINLNKYAKVLFNMAKQKELLAELNASMDFLRKNIEQFKKELLVINFYSLDKKKQIQAIKILLEELKINKLFINMAIILISDNKANVIDNFILKWNEFQLEYEGYTKVEIITAQELSKEQEKEIYNYIKNNLKIKFFLEKKIDPEIIGGLILKVKEFFFDNSILGKLNSLLKVMKG